MPDNYFEIRMVIEEAPVPTGYGNLIRRAIRALDAQDWQELARVGRLALDQKPCDYWRWRIEYVLSDPVFRE